MPVTDLTTPSRLGHTAVLAVVVALTALVCPVVARAAQSTITFQGGAAASTASGTSLTLSAPSTKAVGDMLIIQVEASGNAAVTVGSGFTTITGATGVAPDGNYVITAYKLSTGAGATNITVSWSGNREAVGTYLDYSGVDNLNPFENTPASGTDPVTGTGTTFTLPTLTTTDANSQVVGLALAWPTASTVTTTAPSSTTTRSSAAAAQTSASPYSQITPFDFTMTTPGAIPAATGSFSASTDWEVTDLALRPAVIQFSTPPAVGSLGSLTLTGAAQVKTAQMGNFGVTDTRGTSGSSWSVTVQGASGAGLSPVFAQYCPNSTCGTDTGPGYVTGGATLAAGSLTLSTTGVTWSGGSGGVPASACTSTPCVMDGSSPIRVVSDSSALGTYTSSGWGASSLSLTVPANARAFANPGEIYRADLLWTLTSGP